MLRMNKRQSISVLGVVSAVVLVSGLLAIGASAASSGRTNTAVSKVWTVSVWLARSSTEAGTPIPATVTIDNKTAHRLTGTGCPGVNFSMDVGNATFPNPIPETAAYCGFSIAPGVHVFHTKVITTFEGCSGEGLPKCGKPPKLSALPAGTYQTRIIWPGFGNTLPKPRKFTVTLMH
jgi:hypothetical protein